MVPDGSISLTLLIQLSGFQTGPKASVSGTFIVLILYCIAIVWLITSGPVYHWTIVLYIKCKLVYSWFDTNHHLIKGDYCTLRPTELES